MDGLWGLYFEVIRLCTYKDNLLIREKSHHICPKHTNIFGAKTDSAYRLRRHLFKKFNLFTVFGHILQCTYLDWYIFFINSTTNCFLNCFTLRFEPLHHNIYCNHKIGHYRPHQELSLCSLISHNLSVLTFLVSQCIIHALSPTKFNLHSLFTPLTVLIHSPSLCLHQDFVYYYTFFWFSAYGRKQYLLSQSHIHPTI